jgi:hypothetical protein
VQLTEIVTDPSTLSGSKFLATVKITDAGVLSVLMIVHAAGLPFAIVTSQKPFSLLA